MYGFSQAPAGSRYAGPSGPVSETGRFLLRNWGRFLLHSTVTDNRFLYFQSSTFNASPGEPKFSEKNVLKRRSCFVLVLLFLFVLGGFSKFCSPRFQGMAYKQKTKATPLLTHFPRHSLNSQVAPIPGHVAFPALLAFPRKAWARIPQGTLKGHCTSDASCSASQTALLLPWRHLFRMSKTLFSFCASVLCQNTFSAQCCHMFNALFALFRRWTTHFERLLLSLFGYPKGGGDRKDRRLYNPRSREMKDVTIFFSMPPSINTNRTSNS